MGLYYCLPPGLHQEGQVFVGFETVFFKIRCLVFLLGVRSEFALIISTYSYLLCFPSDFKNLVESSVEFFSVEHIHLQLRAKRSYSFWS